MNTHKMGKWYIIFRNSELSINYKSIIFIYLYILGFYDLPYSIRHSVPSL